MDGGSSSTGFTFTSFGSFCLISSCVIGNILRYASSIYFLELRIFPIFYLSFTESCLQFFIASLFL